MKNGYVLFACLVIALIPGVFWWLQTGGLGAYFSHSMPSGQLAYALTKLAGFYALFALLLQLITAVYARVGWLPRTWLYGLHRALGLAVLGLALLHVLLFFIAMSARQDAWAWDLLQLQWQDYYHRRLSAGLLGLISLLLAAWLGWRRVRGGALAWRVHLHRIYLVSLGLIALHAFSIGSETLTRSGLVFFAALGGLVVLGVMRLLWQGRQSQRSASYEI